VPRKELPPALPPETRPVGQLIAEALRLYGEAFWTVLPIGLPIAITNQVSAGHSHWVQVGVLAAAIPLLTAAYVAACLVVVKERPPGRTIATAFVGGVLVILPVPLLVLIYVLPAVAWLALVGLLVPAALVERLPLRASLRRAVELARADYVHALGSLAAVTVIFALTKIMLILLLRGTADAAERGGDAMATYILLSSLTPQGVQTLKSNPDRLREVNRDVEELGAKVVHQWATLGEYDFVNVVEAPDSATIARVSVALGARGSTKIRTLTALTIDEFLNALA
jgi:uncharacterized protein with GYD domain